jgi:glutaredoxin-like protein NrdH
MVTVYSQPGCGKCKSVIRFLDKNKINHEVLDIREDPKAYDRLVSLGYNGTPVIEANGEHFQGFDPVKLQTLK